MGVLLVAGCLEGNLANVDADDLAVRLSPDPPLPGEEVVVEVTSPERTRLIASYISGSFIDSESQVGSRMELKLDSVEEGDFVFYWGGVQHAPAKSSNFFLTPIQTAYIGNSTAVSLAVVLDVKPRSPAPGENLTLTAQVDEASQVDVAANVVFSSRTNGGTTGSNGWLPLIYDSQRQIYEAEFGSSLGWIGEENSEELVGSMVTIGVVARSSEGSVGYAVDRVPFIESG